MIARTSIRRILLTLSLVSVAVPSTTLAAPAPTPLLNHAPAMSLVGLDQVTVRRRGHWSYPYYYRPYFYRYRYYAPYAYPYYSPYFYSGYWDYPYAVDAGGLDLDVKPEEAQVYLDGELVGKADDFDGFPRYLWVKKGLHQLVFVAEGRETQSRKIEVKPGVVLQVKGEMTVGVSRPAEELFEASLWSNRAGDDGVDSSRPPRRATPYPSQPTGDSSTDAWRQRGDYRGEPAYLKLSVSPPDAAIYLDGRHVGSAEEIERLHAPLLIDVGAHRIEVARPGYREHETEFEATAGEEVQLEIDLEQAIDR